MPELERSLDSLHPQDPGALPPALVAALRSTRRNRRVTITAAAAGVLIPVLVITTVLSRPGAGSSPGTIAGNNPQASPDLPTLAALTRANREFDPKRLMLPESPASPNPTVLPTRFGGPDAANESLLN